MTRPLPRMATLMLAVMAAGEVLTRPAAQAPAAFTLDLILSYPLPEHLIAAPTGSAIAWTFNERGRRNIYLAEGPEFTTRRLTNYDRDDGNELTCLSFSDDGRYLVYARGGRRAPAPPPDSGPPPDPSGASSVPEKELWSIATATGDLKRLGDGDTPAIAPRSRRVAFVNAGRIWLAPIDGSKPAASIYIRGASQSLVWSPDGAALAFVSNRDDHAFIGVFTGFDRPIRYFAPSTSRDSAPVWSPDGGRIAFVRQPGLAETNAALIARPREPWAIWVGNAADGSARPVWKSGRAIEDSMPRVDGGVNLRWGAGDRLVFLSYSDGWPHLYSVAAAGGTPMLLTPGELVVEHVCLSPDGGSIIYSANAGPDPGDLDRRHIFRVPIDSARPMQLTSGTGIEWSPVVAGDRRTLAYLASNVRRVALPTVQRLDGGGEPRTLAEDRVPPDFPSSQLIAPERVTFRAPDGVEVHAQLFKASDGNTPRPAILFLHGGPGQQVLLGWQASPFPAVAYALNQYLAMRGFLVLSVNYRRGIGYGHAFQYPDRERAAAEYEDVMAAARYLQTRPDVDAAHLGSWGGGYGGYLAALMLARNSELFSAGVDVDGPSELVLQEIRRLYASTTDETGERTSNVQIWTSPLMVVRGDDDHSDRFREAVGLERELATQGVPVEVRVVPGDVPDFRLFSSWATATTAAAEYLERAFAGRAAR